MVFLAAILAKRNAGQLLVHYARRLGGPGLSLIAVADSSVVPTFGSMDAVLVIFASRDPQDWPYFALMTLIGSIIGGYLTFRMGRRGGRQMLERRFSKKKLAKVYRWTEEHAFWAISVPSFLPPPTPLTPFILAAGAMHVPTRRFLVAYTSARTVRYALVAWLAARYGRAVLDTIGRYQQPVLIAFISTAVLGAVVGLWYWHKKRQKRVKIRKPQPRVA